jgi:hypothetical protein
MNDKFPVCHERYIPIPHIRDSWGIIPFLPLLLLRVLSHFRTRNWHRCNCILDVLWGQPITLVQVASTSELHENQRNDLLSFCESSAFFPQCDATTANLTL